MKKFLSVLLVLALIATSVFAGGSKEAAPAKASSADDPLVTAAKAEGELVVYGSCEEEYLAAACAGFEKKYGHQGKLPETFYW